MSRFAGWLAGLSVLGLAAAQGNLSQNLKLTLTQDLIRRRDAKRQKRWRSAFLRRQASCRERCCKKEVTAQNISGKALGSFNLDVPLPPGTQFLGAATPSGARWRTQFTTLCAGKALAYAETPLRCVETINGQAVTRSVAPSEYTAVRWVLGEMQAGETLKFGFRVQMK